MVRARTLLPGGGTSGPRTVLAITFAEYGGFVVVVALAVAAGHPDLALIGCAIISGPHLFALAPFVDARAAVAKGVALLAIAGLTVTLVPERMSAGDLWPLGAGWASAIVLWPDSWLAAGWSRRVPAQGRP
jgi:hypothetical protein